MTPRPPRLLLAEDIVLIQRDFRKAGLSFSMDVDPDGVEAAVPGLEVSERRRPTRAAPVRETMLASWRRKEAVPRTCAPGTAPRFVKPSSARDWAMSARENGARVDAGRPSNLPETLLLPPPA